MPSGMNLMAGTWFTVFEVTYLTSTWEGMVSTTPMASASFCEADAWD